MKIMATLRKLLSNQIPSPKPFTALDELAGLDAPEPLRPEIAIPPTPPVKPLTKEEREFLEVLTKNRRNANPQAFIIH
jgi:hypothetical protein